MATDYSADDYKGHKRFVADDGGTYSIHNGDIVSVCATKGGTVRGKALLADAVKNGGDRLDAYSGIYNFYTKNGFEPVSVCKWDDDYAPEEWKKANGFTDDSWKGKSDKNFVCKREDIVFYRYTGKNTTESFEDFRDRVGYSNDYEAAKRKRNRRISNDKK